MRISDWSSDVCSSDLLPPCRSDQTGPWPLRSPCRAGHETPLKRSSVGRARRPDNTDQCRQRDAMTSGGRATKKARPDVVGSCQEERRVCRAQRRRRTATTELGSASCRACVGQSVYLSVYDASLKKK